MKKNIFFKLARKILALFLKRFWGFPSYYAAKEFAGDAIEDLLCVPMSFRQRLWAYKRGFLGRRIKEYGLNDGNYKDYLSDVVYCGKQPLNDCSDFIDDKLKFRYILQPFSDFLPKYYFLLRKGSVARLIDCPHELTGDMVSVIRLLKDERQLALKLLGGEGGAGFYKISCDQDQYLINDTSMDEKGLRAFLSARDNHIVTEYLVSHPFVRNIYSAAPNSLRAMVAHNYGEAPVIIGAMFRMGTVLSGAVDNLAAGGMVCGVNIVNGELYDAKYLKDFCWQNTSVHVDSKVRIEGCLPHWDLIMNKIREMGSFLPGRKFLGFDIIITDEGFKCIEINSHPCVNSPQFYYPFMKNAQVVKMFCGQEKD